MSVDASETQRWQLAELNEEARIVGLIEFQDNLVVGTEARAGGGIACVDPATGAWTCVHRLSEAGSTVTGFAVAQGPGDPQPCLYVTWASNTGGGLLRSEDGRIFAPVLERPGRGGEMSGLRAPAAWAGRLVLAAFGEGRDDKLPAGTVLASGDVAGGGWTALSEPRFGDAENDDICALAVVGGRLHAAVRNDWRGFQLWVTEGSDGAPPHWTKVIGEGAHRFGHSPAVAGLVARGNDLYIGTDHPFPAGPGLAVPAAELLRLELDGHWEVIAGEMRVTPQGLKVPVALLAPGFGHASATRLIPGADGDGLLVAVGPSGAVWRSPDGEEWEPAWFGEGIEGELGGLVSTGAGIVAAIGVALVGSRRKC